MSTTQALLVVPVFMTFIIGVAIELEDIASEASEKAISFSDDMNNAMDCATQGIPISICSPNLMNQEFTADAKEFITTIDGIEQEALLNSTLNSTEV